MQPFRVHWSRVAPALAAGHVPAAAALLAVWPAPANADVCFQAAGFTDFADADEAWDRAAARLLERVVDELRAFGAPRLLSPALRPRRGWRDRLLGRAAPPATLLEQLGMPLHRDELPDAVVAFGPDGASLRTGSGHFLLWITLPEEEVAPFVAGALPRIAAPHPLVPTDLAWEHLLPAAPAGPGGSFRGGGPGA
jgi:hypothetical protein